MWLAPLPELKRVGAKTCREPVGIVAPAARELVVAGAAFDDIVAVATVDDVIAGAADQGLVAVSTIDLIIEAGACQGLVGLVARQDASGQFDRIGDPIVIGPDRAVGEANLLDA